MRRNFLLLSRKPWFVLRRRNKEKTSLTDYARSRSTFGYRSSFFIVLSLRRRKFRRTTCCDGNCGFCHRTNNRVVLSSCGKVLRTRKCKVIKSVVPSIFVVVAWNIRSVCCECRFVRRYVRGFLTAKRLCGAWGASGSGLEESVN